MMPHLVVVRPFGAFRRADIIADPAVMAAILSGGNAADVVHVVTPAAPAAALGSGWFRECEQ